MARYSIIIENKARKQLANIKKSGNKADIKRIEQIFSELANDPTKGTGKPEALKHELNGFWSRRINQKDRLIYLIDENQITVVILSASGHYLDK